MPRPDDAVEQARAIAATGRLSDAITTLRRLITRDPRHAGAHLALADLLQRDGQSEQALFFAQRAADLMPKDPGAFNTLGYALLRAGKPEPAIAAFRKALTFDPRHMLGLSNLCGTLRNLDRLDEAAEAMEAMLAAHPDSEYAYADANLLLQLGMPRDAAALLRRAVARFPHAAWLRRDLCVALNYTDDAAEAELFREHSLLGASFPPAQRVEPVDPDPNRPLRVAYISPDFREHSVAYFLRPLLDHPSGIIPHCYACSRQADATTDRLRAWAESSGGCWREAAGLSDESLIRLIRADRIDIAVDLAGWSAGSRLAALSRRAAPIQVSYLGYPNTTGLSAIDGRFVDSLTDPAESGALAVEHLMRLDPCFLAYSPPDDAPEPRPRDADAPATFGSFNSIRKITPTTIRLWARALKQVPASRLILKSPGLGSARARAHVLALFSSEGIAAERLDLLDRVESRAAHLALYHRIDIALDTFPYHGTTTTCEALWMGIPVVSLVGPAHRSHVALSLLTAAGLPELAVTSPEAFAQTAGALIQQPTRLNNFRATLRSQLRASPLCDTGGCSARFAAALRALWRAKVSVA